jgi:hypothetical protein
MDGCYGGKINQTHRQQNKPEKRKMIKITTKWTTIATVCYTGSVGSRSENPAAHGGVCHLQARTTPDGGLLGRKVNSNMGREEKGESFPLDSDTLDSWRAIEKATR